MNEEKQNTQGELNLLSSIYKAPNKNQYLEVHYCKIIVQNDCYVYIEKFHIDL